MLEELIEKYLQAKNRYVELSIYPEDQIAYENSEFAFNNASDDLLAFIEKHSDALISWERQHALRLSPFEDPE